MWALVMSHLLVRLERTNPSFDANVPERKNARSVSPGRPVVSRRGNVLKRPSVGETVSSFKAEEDADAIFAPARQGRYGRRSWSDISGGRRGQFRAQSHRPGADGPGWELVR